MNYIGNKKRNILAGNCDLIFGKYCNKNISKHGSFKKTSSVKKI